MYSSFDQIDKDLRILKLRKEISREELSLKLNGAKNEISSSISPVSTIVSFVGSFAQKAVIAKLVSAVFRRK